MACRRPRGGAGHLHQARGLMGRKEYLRAYHAKIYSTNRQRAILLLGSRCAKCGSDDKLEFDHVNSSVRNGRIGPMFGYSWDKSKAELALCQLLCFECHIAKTTLEMGKSPASHGRVTMCQKGCRCPDCRRAQSAENAKRPTTRAGRRRKCAIFG
jgi:hypothetical protein